MRISLINFLCFFFSLIIIGWGALLVTGYTEYDLIPSNFQFLNLPSLAIVFGGVTASVFITYPFNSVFKALAVSTKLFSYSPITTQHLEKDIQKVIEWQQMIKEDKINTISSLSDQYQSQFEGYLFSVLDTNYSIQDLRELGEINIEENFSRQQYINQIISNMGKTAPVFGMLGTLFGLIIILSGFNEVESLLEGLGTALMTTLYGILISNFIFTPMSKKMNDIAVLRYFRERLILEGIVLIEESKSPIQIYDRLHAYIRDNKSIM